jgi:VWFA-related protein
MMGMKMRLTLLLAVGSLLAQDATIRVDVQQVLVPVVVTDKKGHHVSGLKAADFQVFEDGVRQDIAGFSSDKAGSVDDMVALSKTATAASSGPRHTFVICIDTLHASPANAARTRQALENLFETEKPAGAQYVLIGIGRQLQVLQPATTNPLEILVKIRSAGWQNAMGGMDASALAVQVQNIRARVDEFCKRCACGTGGGERNCDSEVDTLKQTVDGEAERWSAPLNGLAGQFKSVVEELAKLPTGRTLILVSDGFNLDARREFYSAVAAYMPDRPQFKLKESGSTEPLQEALKVASERNVTIYTVDSRNGGGTAPYAGGGTTDATTSGMGQGGSTDMLGTNRASSPTRRVGPVQSTANTPGNPLRTEESASMKEVAQATGGVYFHDSAEMLKQFRNALADGREYYVLAYAPKNGARDGKYRTITVETADKKLNIRAKAGYWAEGAAQ